MKVSEILDQLPASLEWMVLFDLTAISQITSHETIRAMYHLPEATDLTGHSHVVLTSIGRFLADASQSQLIEPLSGQDWDQPQETRSLSARFAEQLALFPVDEADCLGLGQIDAHEPVLLHIKIVDGIGQAQAVLERAPTGEHFELLQAVGVKFLGGEQDGAHYLARFQNRLPVHIHAGILSHFSRTSHCNIFFLQHCVIDSLLEAGLVEAAQKRIAWGQRRSLETLEQLAQQSCQQVMAMVCQPPAPDRRFYYGDLVPLGFVLRGLRTGLNTLRCQQAVSATTAEQSTLSNTLDELEAYVNSQRQGGLWAFHQGRLVTATDSALVLQGMDRTDMTDALIALDTFAAEGKGYYPQLWAGESIPDHMIIDESCRHWCQPDYATTCLIVALRQQAGLPTDDQLAILKHGMNNRSGLYFANPHLVDWVLAQAIQMHPNAALIRQQLVAEVLASMNEDFSFGRFDLPFSTALAILTLATLGYRGRPLLAAQLRLLDWLNSENPLPIATPFYSSLRMDHGKAKAELIELSLLDLFSSRPWGDNQCQIQGVGDQYHGISLYHDVHRAIASSVIVMALSEVYAPQQNDVDTGNYPPSQDVHPRYLHRNHCEYIANVSLPPYLGQQRASMEPLLLA